MVKRRRIYMVTGEEAEKPREETDGKCANDETK